MLFLHIAHWASDISRLFIVLSDNFIDRSNVTSIWLSYILDFRFGLSTYLRWEEHVTIIKKWIFFRLIEVSTKNGQKTAPMRVVFRSFFRLKPRSTEKKHIRIILSFNFHTYDVTIQLFGWYKNHLNVLTNQNKRYAITLINIKWYLYHQSQNTAFYFKACFPIWLVETLTEYAKKDQTKFTWTSSVIESFSILYAIT